MAFTINPNFNSFYYACNTVKNPCMYINMFIDDDEKLKQLYVNAAKKHNQKILEDPHFYDAGFDLFLPENQNIFWGNSVVNKVDFKVKCSAKLFNVNDSRFTPFYTYARSSLSKTPLRLANNQGIIDAGYRGNLIGMFDCVYSTNNSDDREFDWYVDDYTRLLQICSPGLHPIYVNIVDTLEELGPNTSRGDGGFGSTGK